MQQQQDNRWLTGGSVLYSRESTTPLTSPPRSSRVRSAGINKLALSAGAVTQSGLVLKNRPTRPPKRRDIDDINVYRSAVRQPVVVWN